MFTFTLHNILILDERFTFNPLSKFYLEIFFFALLPFCDLIQRRNNTDWKAVEWLFHKQRKKSDQGDSHIDAMLLCRHITLNIVNDPAHSLYSDTQPINFQTN